MDKMAWAQNLGVDPKDLQLDHMTQFGQPEQHLSALSDSFEDVHPSLRYLSNFGNPHSNVMVLAGPNLGVQAENFDMPDFASPPLRENNHQFSAAFASSSSGEVPGLGEANTHQSTSHGGNQTSTSTIWPPQALNAFSDVDMHIFNEPSKSMSWQPVSQDSFIGMSSTMNDFTPAKIPLMKPKPVAKRSQNPSSRNRKNRMRLSTRRSSSPAHNKHAQAAGSQTSHSSSSKTSSQVDLTVAPKVDPQEAIALFEASIQPFSTFSQLKAADLINQLKQLVLEEQKYGKGSQPGSSDVITTTTAPPTQGSISDPGMIDSECLTGNTSVSSSPRQPLKDSEDTDDSMSTDESQTEVKHEPCENCGVKALLHCTWKNCGYSTHSFADYKRHESGEKHWPQERWMCLECVDHSTPAINSGPTCTFCRVPFSALGVNIPVHYVQSRVQCQSARKEITTFSRKDHLINHLRKDHNMLNMNKTIDTWKLGIDSNWPRQCGFCGIFFGTWNDRMNHLKREFKKGNDMSKWKLPFPKSMDFRPSGPTLPRDDDDDDQDDNLGGNGGSWTKSAGKLNAQSATQSQNNASRNNMPQKTSAQRRYRKANTSGISTSAGAVDSDSIEAGKTSITLQRYLNDTEEPNAARLSLRKSDPISATSVEKEAVRSPGLQDPTIEKSSDTTDSFRSELEHRTHIDKAHRAKVKAEPHVPVHEPQPTSGKTSAPVNIESHSDNTNTKPFPRLSQPVELLGNTYDSLVISHEDEDDVPSDEDEDEDAESCNEQSDVRRFMIGMVGEDDSLMSRDQVDLVASFCEKSKAETNEKEKRKLVALLDERCMDGTMTDKRGFYRPYQGPLTCQELRERLSRKRFRADSEKDLATLALEDEQHNAARRIVFIADLDSSAIEALVTTVALTQAPALRNLFYKHLTGTASIGVTIKHSGFQNFTLDFHLPYYVLRESKKSWRDTREKSNGKPLRQFWELPFLSMPTNNKPVSTDERYCLYEAMTSVGVTGNDHWTWAAYGFVDTYFDSRESVDGYHEMKERRGGRADPLADGQINADEPLWDPREYFLKVVEIRTGLALMEWSQIINKMEREVKQSRTNLFLALSSNDPKAKQEVTNFIRWNLCMTNFLRLLEMKLSDTVAAWDSFRETGIYYFNDYSVIPIEAAFGKLKAQLQKLRNLEKELRQDNPDGLNVHLGLENIEATDSQQKTARQLEILTVIIIIFFPLALSANLFSTTGVLPFTPNLTTFTFVFLSLGILILATLVVLSHWRSWLHQVVKYNKKAIAYYNERFDGEDASIIPPKVLKRAMLSRRFRKASPPPEEWDPEKGVKKD